MAAIQYTQQQGLSQVTSHILRLISPLQPCYSLVTMTITVHRLDARVYYYC